jgi:heat shock protein HslJ
MVYSPLRQAGWGLLVAVLLIACSDKDMATDSDKTESVSQTRSTDMTPSADRVRGMWELVAFQSGEATALNDDLADVEVTASFSSDGSVSGRSGCNRYSASVDVDDSGMRVGAVAGTKMACPGVRMKIEQAYTQSLTSVRNYRFDGDTLMLLDEDSTPLLRFERPAKAEDKDREAGETNGSAGLGD